MIGEGELSARREAPGIRSMVTEDKMLDEWRFWRVKK